MAKGDGSISPKDLRNMFCFKTKSELKLRNKEYQEYSGVFFTTEDALKWYFDKNRGGFLRKLFKRELFLFKGKEKLNIEFL